MGDDTKAHARIATHETRGKMLQATHALVSGQIVITEEPLIIVPPTRRHGASFFTDGMHELDLLQAFENQNQSNKDKILDFHSPTDGTKAKMLRARYRSVLSQEALEVLVKVNLSFLVVCITTSTFADDVGCSAIAIGIHIPLSIYIPL